MNEQTSTAAKAVFDTMRHAARYWVPFYDTLDVDELAEARRKRAIGSVVSTLSDHYAPDGTFQAPSIHELAALIVDSSEWSFWGFDAIEVEPTPWWRFGWRQNRPPVVPSKRV